MGNIIQSIPEAKLLLASLRSVGYTEETAIADIVDNCISAKAKHIDIIFETEKMRILILDDGIGMTAQALIENMRIGSSDPSKQRDDTDLGRFGMGMKTAAFSLGKRLTVVTRFEESTSNAAWDLDKIPDIGWNLIIEESDSIAEISSRLGAQGTVVCIENLDRVIGSLDEAKAKKKFYKTAEKVEKHLALIFHRFIEEDGLVIRINGTEIQPWNPFVINNNDVYHVKMERLSRSTYIPVAKGKPTDQWFYERARGQYLVELSRQPTKAAKDQFKSRCPKNRCISKTVAAKCVMAWSGYPYIVSKGLETNFVFFSDMVSKGEFPEPSEQSYIEMISRVILFNRCDDIIKSLKFGGFKAQQDYYTVALIGKYYSDLINPQEIWNNQDINAETAKIIETLAYFVWEHFQNPSVPGVNIGQWCKKEDCWELLQKRFEAQKDKAGAR